MCNIPTICSGHQNKSKKFLLTYVLTWFVSCLSICDFYTKINIQKVFKIYCFSITADSNVVLIKLFPKIVLKHDEVNNKKCM